MAKKERNKRAARKARQKERERVAAAQAVSAANSKNDNKRSKKSRKNAAKTKAVAKADRKGIQVVTGYFSDVRAEMHKVTWPSRIELRSYTIAVIVMLIVFGVVIWLVDTGFVAVLVQYTGLRG